MSNKEPANAGEMQDKRDKKGRFKPGKSGNPEGKIKGTKNYITQLEEAIEKYETIKGKKLFDRLIERAFVNDRVMLSVVRKFIADKTEARVIMSKEDLNRVVDYIVNVVDENIEDEKIKIKIGEALGKLVVEE